METKKCRICSQEKPLDLFEKATYQIDGISGRCRACATEAQKKWVEAHGEEVRAAARQRQRVYRERKKRGEKFVPKYMKRGFKAHRMNPGDYKNMMASQGGKCAICSRAPKRLYVDHDHKSGKVRALLCLQCNIGIGHFGENIDMLNRAIEYLKRHAVTEPAPRRDEQTFLFAPRIEIPPEAAN